MELLLQLRVSVRRRVAEVDLLSLHQLELPLESEVLFGRALDLVVWQVGRLGLDGQPRQVVFGVERPASSCEYRFGATHVHYPESGIDRFLGGYNLEVEPLVVAFGVGVHSGKQFEGGVRVLHRRSSVVMKAVDQVEVARFEHGVEEHISFLEDPVSVGLVAV